MKPFRVYRFGRTPSPRAVRSSPEAGLAWGPRRIGRRFLQAEAASSRPPAVEMPNSGYLPVFRARKMTFTVYKACETGVQDDWSIGSMWIIHEVDLGGEALEEGKGKHGRQSGWIRRFQTILHIGREDTPGKHAFHLLGKSSAPHPVRVSCSPAALGRDWTEAPWDCLQTVTRFRTAGSRLRTAGMTWYVYQIGPTPIRSSCKTVWHTQHSC